MKNHRIKTATGLRPSNCDGSGQSLAITLSSVSVDKHVLSRIGSDAIRIVHADEESALNGSPRPFNRPPRIPFQLQIASLIPDFCRELQIHRCVISSLENAKRLAETLLGNLALAGTAPAFGRLRNHATIHEMKRAVIGIRAVLTPSSTPATYGGNTPLHRALNSSGSLGLNNSTSENIGDPQSCSYQFPLPLALNPAPTSDWTLHLKTCPEKGRESAETPFLLVRNTLAPGVLSASWVSMVPHPDFRYRVSMPGGPLTRPRWIPS